MFGKLDRYLARSFIEPFLVTAMAITGLYIVADAFSHVDEYLRQASSILEALEAVIIAPRFVRCQKQFQRGDPDAAG